MIEIERKFLVNNENFKKEAITFYTITQGYLSTDPERTVRIRTKADKGFITIKGKSNKSGMSRFEWEKEIPVSEALTLLGLCKPHPIKKTRYEIKVGNHTFEVDEFTEKNKGLILAEIELSSETDLFEKPIWLGKEVTGNKRFYNSFLAIKPYCDW